MAARKSKDSPRVILNDEQEEVVKLREGYFQVVAGPGSGKSQCLVARFAALIEEGISSNDILSLSFTKIAAKNLRDRVEQIVGKLSISRTGSGASTFHSLALSFAREEKDEFDFPLAEGIVAPEPIANKLSAESARRYEVDPRSLRSRTSLWKRNRVRPAQAIRDCESRADAKELKLALAYKDYQKKCRDAGLLDFDSLIFEMVDILERKPKVRERWVWGWLQLDESQDMSQIEWSLVRLISGKSVLAVGDQSQGIYKFRGSDPELFASMDSIFPGTQKLFLGCNYRSTPEIVDFIRPIASAQDLAERFHTKNPSGPMPQIKGFVSAEQEAEWIVSQLKPKPKEDECSLLSLWAVPV